MATPAEIKALFETGDVLLASSFVTFIDSVHPEACDLGTFTGTTITDNGTIKEALQELETALESGGGVTDHGALTGLADDDHTQYLLANGSRAISAPITGATPTISGHLATKGYVDGLAADFQYENKTDDFTATPGKIYLVSLAANDVIATVPTTAGACSLVVVEAGTSATGYGSYDTETKMLLHCDALIANETPDEIGSARFIAGSTLSTSIKKFGTASIAVNPSSGTLDIDNGAAISGAGDWTFEGWFYWSTAAESDSVIFESRDGGIKEFAVEIQSGALTLSDNSTTLDTGSSPAADTWHHIAIVRDATSDDVNVYFNGTLDMTGSVASVTGGAMFLQQPDTLSNALHIDELRWRSDKVYTTAFTPPTAAFGFDTPAPTAANKLTIAGTDLEFFAAGDRIDFQADGTETVYQVIDDTPVNLDNRREYFPTIANNSTDAEHDLDIGTARIWVSDGTTEKLVDFAAATIAIDGAGLDTGTVANSTWYYLWAIYNPTTDAADYLISVSDTSPTLPSGYTYKRRLKEILTDASANILSGTWYDDFFVLDSRVIELNTLSPATTVTDLAVTTPPVAGAIWVGFMQCNFAAGEVAFLFSPDANHRLLQVRSQVTGNFIEAYGFVPTETGQIKYNAPVVSSGGLAISTLGWITRKQN